MHSVATCCFSLLYHYHNAVSTAISFNIFFPEIYVAFISLNLVSYTIFTHTFQPCSTAYLRDMYIFLVILFYGLIFLH